MKKFLLILIFFLISGYFINFIIADTGYNFAYNYLINKLEIDNTKNKISIKDSNFLLTEERDEDYLLDEETDARLDDLLIDYRNYDENDKDFLKYRISKSDQGINKDMGYFRKLEAEQSFKDSGQILFSNLKLNHDS